MTHMYKPEDLPAGCPIFVIRRYGASETNVVCTTSHGGVVLSVTVPKIPGTSLNMTVPPEDVFKTSWECRFELRRRVGLLNEAYTRLVELETPGT